MYKDLFRLVIDLVSNPGKTWKELAEKEEVGELFLSRFVYPLIGLVTLAAFLGILLTEKKFNVELAMKSSIKAAVSAFGGFHLTAYLLNEIGKNYLGRTDSLKRCQLFTGYASAGMFALNAVLSLVPTADFFFLRIFLLYTVYIVWAGAALYMGVDEKGRMRFVTIASILIIGLPELIGGALFLLMPGFRGI
jgi:hypothetical protein